MNMNINFPSGFGTIDNKCKIVDSEGNRICSFNSAHENGLCGIHEIAREASEIKTKKLNEVKKVDEVKKNVSDDEPKNYEKVTSNENKQGLKELKQKARDAKEEAKQLKEEAKEEAKRLKEEAKEEVKRLKEQSKEAKKELEKSLRDKSFKDAKEQYSLYKEEFENEYLMVSGIFIKINSDGTRNKHTNDQMVKITANKIIKTIDENGNEKKEKFLNMWLADEERADYDFMKFYPPEFKGDIIEGKVHNTWNGFEIEKTLNKNINIMFNDICMSKLEKWNTNLIENLTSNEEIKQEQKEIAEQVKKSFELNDEKITELIDPILKHIDFITGNNKDFLLKWLARIIQYPGQKTECAVLIRDMGSLFKESGGIGKNLLIDFFGKKILGKKYYHVVSENRELYEDFNTSFNDKLLVFVEEAGGKENYDHKNDMKSKITKKDISVQGKGDNRFTTEDFCNYIFTTNNEKPLPIDKRRFAVFDSLTDKRGDIEYFEYLTNHLDKFETSLAFYHYLKNLNTWDSIIKIQSAIPDTLARSELIRNSACQFMKWLASFETLYFLKERHTATDTYLNFCTWYKNSREGTDANIMKKKNFFDKLSKEESLFVKSKKSSIFYEANIDYLMDNLKKQHLISQDYSMAQVEEEYRAYKESIGQ